MTTDAIYINAFAVACALGQDNRAVAQNLFAAAPVRVSDVAELLDGTLVPVGRLPFTLPAIANETRTNCLIDHCYTQIADAVAHMREHFGPTRLGVVMGTSTSGVGEAGEAIRQKLTVGDWPEGFLFQAQLLGDTARYTASRCGALGPYYTISTACTSGARALAAAARLLRADLCDAVLCGGADTLAPLTLNGFAALDSLSNEPSNPMSRNRKGLNIGEGGALFLLSREAGQWRLAGWGESSDAHHISAPDPSGAGATIALRRAIDLAGLQPPQIGYIHLHGTATQLNDRMEAGVIARMFGDSIPASSTKPLTGHTLGAAGAVQAAFCLMALERGQLPPHVWDGEQDPALPVIRLSQPGERTSLNHVLSASYAFGGNNTALVLASA